MGAEALPPDWPFEDVPRTACFTCDDVLWHGAPICIVTHDEDGDWQFLPLDGAPSDVRQACLVALEEMLERDPTIAEVADLPVGWRAVREAPGMPWIRRLCPPEH